MTSLLITMSLLLGLIGRDPPKDQPQTALTVRVGDLAPSRGQLVIALFDSAESFSKRSGSLRSVVVPVESATYEWQVEDLASGEYAVVVYQDLNVNGELDRGRLGIPKEPYGFSNGVRGAFGPPPFDKARFTFDGSGETIEIELNHRSSNRNSDSNEIPAPCSLPSGA